MSKARLIFLLLVAYVAVLLALLILFTGGARGYVSAVRDASISISIASATPTPTPTPTSAWALDWDGTLGESEAVCQYDPRWVTVRGTVNLTPPTSMAYLQTSWQVVEPGNPRCPPEVERCFEAQYDSQPITGGTDFEITGWWPGIRPDDEAVEVHFAANVLDEGQNPLHDGVGKDLYWYPWVCPPPTPTPTVTPTPEDTPTPPPADTPTPTPAPGECRALRGAIWTTDANGNRVNQNLYERKEDVYLNGGPDSGGGPGLPDGYYFYRVTTPGGDPLYGEPRVVQIVDGRFRNLVQLAPFDDSPNREYKVWLSALRDFPPSCSKTDNFRIKR